MSLESPFLLSLSYFLVFAFRAFTMQPDILDNQVLINACEVVLSSISQASR